MNLTSRHKDILRILAAPPEGLLDAVLDDGWASSTWLVHETGQSIRPQVDDLIALGWVERHPHRHWYRLTPLGKEQKDVQP